MLLNAFVIGLIAVFGRLDSRMLGRLNFERPLITCTLVGLFLGDLKTGLAVGASMEMVSLGFMSIGASGFDMNMGSIVGCAIVIMTGSDISTALAIATPMTLLSTLIETGADILRISMTHMIDSSVEAGNFKRAKNLFQLRYYQSKHKNSSIYPYTFQIKIILIFIILLFLQYHSIFKQINNI